MNIEETLYSRSQCFGKLSNQSEVSASASSATSQKSVLRQAQQPVRSKILVKSMVSAF